MEKVIPVIGQECYLDMISQTASREAKANAARRYTEMMVYLFLSDKLKNDIGDDSFYQMKLKDVICKIENYTYKPLINLLNHIKNIGNVGSHYHPQKKLSEDEVTKVVNCVIDDLLPLILVNYIIKEPFEKHPFSAKIFSILLPSVRERVLYELIDFNNIKSENDKFLLHKYVMACHKNNKRDKIRRKLRSLKKKGVIDAKFYEALCITIKNFDENSNSLPIPETMQDCKRNFNSVIESIGKEDVERNKRLIKIISLLLDNVMPSEIGNLIPNSIFFNLKL